MAEPLPQQHHARWMRQKCGRKRRCVARLRCGLKLMTAYKRNRALYEVLPKVTQVLLKNSGAEAVPSRASSSGLCGEVNGVRKE